MYDGGEDSSKTFVERTTFFFKEHQRLFLTSLTIFLLLIPLIFAVWFRTYPATLPAAQQWAQSSVQNSVKSQIAAGVAQQYPNLPLANREQLVNEQLSTFLSKNKAQFDAQVASTATLFRQQLQDESGHTYWLAIDPYQYLRLVEDMLDHGYPGDELRNGTPYDKHMLAPIGRTAGTNLHLWLSAWLYRFESLFVKTTPMHALFWLPVILAALAVIPAFFLGKRYGLLTGFFTAMLIAVHAGFIGRTVAGFVDTDAYVILFPLLAGLFLLEALSRPNNWEHQAIFLSLSGFTFGLFSWVWKWWYFFDVFLLALLAFITFASLRSFLQERHFFTKEIQRGLLLIVFFVLLTGIFVSFFSTPSAFLKGFTEPIHRTEGIKAAVNVGALWPNVLTTVAELNAPSISGIISNIGGKLLFVLALLGVLASLVPKKGKLLVKDWLLLSFGLLIALYLAGKGTSLSIFSFLIIMALPVVAGFLFLLKDEREVDVKYALFLFVWMAASVFTMTKGVRFVLLLIPPFALAVGIAVQRLYQLGKEWLADTGLKAWWVAPALFLLFALLLLPPIQAGHRTGLNEVPSMSDAWWSALTKIKQESQPDAIINSWWDFGHWFKYVADRAVTFDGASQNTPMAHWIGRALLTSDEKEALGILRMLDCGSSLGAQDVQQGLPSHDQYEAIMLTKKIIMLPKEAARSELLAANISEDHVAIILNHTHCEPPEDYFITSADMVGKGGVWGHFGAWNFSRADAYAHLRKLPEAEATRIMQEKYGWSAAQASKIYFDMQTLPTQNAVNTWVSPWPSLPMSDWRSCRYAANGTAISCPLRLGIGRQNGVQTVLDQLLVNLTNMSSTHLEVGFYDASGRKVGENKEVLPGTIVLVQNESFGKYVLAGEGFNQAFLIDARGTPRVLMTDPANAESMFVRLFFLDGYGTRAFTKFDEEHAFNMGKIVVWKVDWSKLHDFGLA